MVSVKVLILGLGASGGGAEAAEYYLKLGHDVEIISPRLVMTWRS